MAELPSGIQVRWSGTHSPYWDEWRALSDKEIYNFPVCKQCGVSIDALTVEPMSDDQFEKGLEWIKELILETSEHGHHRLPGTDKFAPGQKPPDTA